MNRLITSLWKFLSKIDLRLWYQQLQLKELYKPKTTLWTQYENWVMCNIFWLNQCKCYFYGFNESEFWSYLDYLITVLINDVLIYSKFHEEKENYFRIALQTIREHHLLTNFEKCDFWLTEAKFLRYVISRNGL